MKKQRGFGMIAAIVVLVILASLAAGIVSLNSTQQITSAQDILAARAMQAARAGNEWGLYQALRNGVCDASTTLDLNPETGFSVSVYCAQKSFNEGENPPGTPRTVSFYEIRAVACPASTCPSTDAAVVASPAYVERTRVVVATN